MRARQRHFNPAHTGATAAFDARYGIAVANGAGVDTWTNRVGSNNATQSTSASRPTFESTGGNNNSPTLRFSTSGVADTLTHSISITVAPSLFLAVATRTSDTNKANYPPIATFCPPFTANFNMMYAAGFGAGSENWGHVPTDSGQSIENVWRICTAKPASTATSNSSTTVWTNGANETTTTGSRYAGDSADRRGICGDAQNVKFDGAISQVVAIPADVSNPLRKRLEHASAFSFKIACS